MPVAVLAFGVGALVGFGTAFTVSDAVKRTGQAVAIGAGVYLAAKYGGRLWKG